MSTQTVEEQVKAILKKNEIPFAANAKLPSLTLKLSEASVNDPDAAELLIKMAAETEVPAEEVPAEAETEAKEAKEPKKAKEAKLINAEDIRISMAELIQVLYAFEKQQVKLRKPWRHIFQTKRRLTILAGAFKRNQ